MSKDRRSIRERLTERTDPGEWGNEAPHAEAIKELIYTYWQLILITWTCFVLFLCVLFFNQGGFVDFSASNSTHQEHSDFALRVAANGETVYTSAENVSHALREVIMDKVYPSPEAAVEAVEGPLPGNPALAHAVNICTHSDGKVSNQTGGGRHLTWFVKHENGRHFTKTAHQVLTINGYQTTDVFAYDVSRNYCNCW